MNCRKKKKNKLEIFYDKINKRKQKSLFVQKRRSNDIARYVSGDRIEKLSGNQCRKNRKKIVLDTYTVGVEVKDKEGSCTGLKKLSKLRAKTAPRQRYRHKGQSPLISPKTKKKSYFGSQFRGKENSHKNDLSMTLGIFRDKEKSSYRKDNFNQKSKNSKNTQKNKNYSLDSKGYRTFTKLPKHLVNGNSNKKTHLSSSKDKNIKNASFSYGYGFFLKSTKKSKLK